MYICFQCQSRYPVNNGWCVVCVTSGTIMLEPKRPRAGHRDGFQATSARELLKRKWSMVESRAYPELRLGRGALLAAYGPPGGGKSTLATRWANGLEGPAVYYSAEERLGPTVAERLERCGVTRADFHVIGQGSIDEVIGFARETKAHALVVDSLQAVTIRPEELRPLREAAGVDVLVVVSQVTKAGLAAGENAVLHELDVVLRVEDMRWAIEKSRYQERIAGDVLAH